MGGGGGADEDHSVPFGITVIAQHRNSNRAIFDGSCEVVGRNRGIVYSGYGHDHAR